MRQRIIIFTLVSWLTTACSGAVQHPSTVDEQERIPVPVSQHLHVDQFGYRPTDTKICVISDPVQGWNADEHVVPAPQYEIRDARDQRVVLTVPTHSWQGGRMDQQSGDRGWHVDFSHLTTPGDYYVYDPHAKVRSYSFRVDPLVYEAVLRTACRMFFYNRANHAKQPPYADPRWSDTPAYVGAQQDAAARPIWAKDQVAEARNCIGAWFDAGDTNKYVTFLPEALHSLLSTYRRYPEFWADFDLNIPESDNGHPDILDEVQLGLDWLLRMQDSDGGVFIKLGTLNYKHASPPSQDRRPRYYAPKSTAASIAAAGILAHAALAWEEGAYRERLLDAAGKAWQWYQTHDDQRTVDTDQRIISGGDADRSPLLQEGDAMVAAIYLFAATGETVYHDWIRKQYQKLQPWQDSRWGMWQNSHGSAIMQYVRLENADPDLRQTILAKRRNELQHVDIYKPASALNLYRAFNPIPTWGSNRTLCDIGQTVLEVTWHDLAPERTEELTDRAAGILHYLHGVNPLNLVYLSNMYEYGAERCVNRMFHTWFAPDTPWSDARSGPGPAPGYLTGGPNPNDAALPIPGSTQTTAEQPPQKAYVDDNRGHGIWAITEPAIYYQAAYIELLAEFVAEDP